MKLTDSACKNAKPSDKIRKLADGGGLYLEIAPNGKKYWRQKYRFAEKEKRLAHGVYPEVTLAEAREKRETARKLLASGKDPATEKQAQKRENVLNAVNTFEAIGREWHEKHSQKVSKGHADTILFRLEKELFPFIGKRPIREINAPIVLDIIRKIEKRGAHDMALRAKQHCGQILRYAIATGRAERDCTPDLKDALVTVKTTHYASIDPPRTAGILASIRTEQSAALCRNAAGHVFHAFDICSHQ